ncbi:MAG: cytochrome c [Calditrichaeota bacterium]|nr:MAG: cytochrome c [Calditrichota bacterium]
MVFLPEKYHSLTKANPGRKVLNVWYMSLILIVSLTFLVEATEQGSSLEDQVIQIFEQNCARAGCHVGSTPMMGLKLTREEFYARTVNQPSVEKPELMRIKPGEPDESYLIKKIIGEPDIIGSRMPFGRDPLTDEEIAIIVEWVKELKTTAVAHPPVAIKDPALPFLSWKVVNLPTSRMVDKGNWLFLIEHRFFPKLSSGYETFYGLDGSGIIFLNMGYAVSDRLFLNLGRSNSQDEVEFNVKYSLKQQFENDPLPLAAALLFSTNWVTEKKGDESRFRSEAFKFSLQAILSSKLHQEFSLNVVPGILINPNSELNNEDPLITLGIAGRAHLWKSISIIGEWVPIVSGFTLTSTFGAFNRFDSWGGGIELTVGGHAFHIIVSNSAGLTTPQYLQGGDLDIEDFDLRLGFNIFRPLQF